MYICIEKFKKRGGLIKIINLSLLIVGLISLSSCCVFVKDSQTSCLTPSETIICFLDAIQKGDYQTTGEYLSDESIESFYRMLSILGDLEVALESDPAFIEFLNEADLNLDEVVEMPKSDIVGLIFVSTAHEDPDIFDYEILREDICGDTAIVYFKTDSEVEIPMVLQEGEWKISFELWD